MKILMFLDLLVFAQLKLQAQAKFQLPPRQIHPLRNTNDESVKIFGVCG
jgi:hypothetical protein